MIKSILFVLLFTVLPCLADEPDLTPVVSDSVPVPAQIADSMFVIPAGPPAGSFTSESRITIADTVAGWAKIYVEGWVPVGAIEDRFEKGAVISGMMPGTPATSAAQPPIEKKQCAAMTIKGTQCKRPAKKGSIYCWQHQSR